MPKIMIHRRSYHAVLLFAVTWFLFVLLCPVLTATAVNNDYLQEEKWHDNPNVTWEEVRATAVDRSVTGWLGWYLDSDRCLYTSFQVSSDLPENYQNARIAYHVHTDTEDYDFAVDADGICDTLSDEVARLFDVRSNFEECGRGLYLTAVQYLGKASVCRISISFYDGVSFRLKEEINADLPAEPEEEEPTQYVITKDTTTKAATTKESTTKRTGSYSQSAGSAAGKTSRGTEKTTATTKFEPQGNYFAEKVASEATEAAVTNDRTTEGKTVMAKDALLLLAVGVLILLIGGGLLMTYRLKNRSLPSCDGQEQESAAEAPLSEKDTES